MNFKTGTHYLFIESSLCAFIVKVTKNLSTKKDYCYQLKIAKTFTPKYGGVGEEFAVSHTKGPGGGTGGWSMWNLKDPYTIQYAKDRHWDLTIPKTIREKRTVRKLSIT
jgi:hypothetical protein